MTKIEMTDLFCLKTLNQIFPPGTDDRFFEALLGDAAEGAFDICLKFAEQHHNQLRFTFDLKQRPGKCLTCSLTYGLPHVFSRHPVINVKERVKQIEHLLGEDAHCCDWQLGTTREVSSVLHTVPLTIFLKK